MSQHRPVPRLDLAPKLKRPLSLWNPLDYLRLLYWVFFFPQALRWYVDTFGGEYIPPKEMNWRKGWKLLRQNPIHRQLLLQGLALTVVTPLALGTILQQIGVPLDWSGVSWGMVLGVAVGVAAGVEFGVAVGVEFGVAVGVVSGVTSGVEFGVEFGVAVGVALGMVVGVVSGVTSGVAVPVVLGLVAGVLLSVVFSIVLSLSGGVVLSLSGGVTAGVVVSLSILRPENWLLGLPLALRSPWNGSWQLIHVTPLPLFSLSSRLTNWLRPDWETGLHNVNQLLAYTLQFYPVVKAVNQVLAETPPDQVIFRVIQLAEAPFDWKLVYFASASLNKALKSKAVEGFWLLPIGWQQRFQARFVTDTRLDSPARAAAAGFWHLHEKEPAKAMEAFAVVRSLLYGEEMFTLAQTLTAFQDAKDPAEIAILQAPVVAKEPVLRPASWKAIASLRRVVEEVQVIQQQTVSRFFRRSSLNRALGELTNILDKSNTLSEAEQGLIVDIAQTWKEALLRVTSKVGEISITKPISNPYVVGNPVQENLFVGREDILRRLEELWAMRHQRQSVVLYGHRRMGKTSILRNVASCLGAEVKVAYINLLNMGATSQGVGEVLMAITDAISEAVGCTPPSDADLLNLPYRTFERYLKQVEAHLSGGLIVALDEFEKIEELIEAEKIPKDFMGYLRGLVQMSSKVAFAFAGLHTLEEMTADYFQPFFASVIPIHVGFLQPGATRQILANPDEDFPLDYTPEALDRIYALTAGQPYLVQLVGFQLVRRYNDYVFEQGRPRDPVFTVEDVEAVINDPEFFKRGRYYFDGVWGQAARSASGQQAILKALAPHPEGLSIDALVHSTGMDEKTLQEGLKTLKRHDVVEESEGCWRIIVELFRRWVLQP
jgi:AAA+ ATPase superfamily predicted ATPase